MRLCGDCVFSGLLEQNCLGAGTPERMHFLNVIGADTLFIEAKFLAVNLEEFFLSTPILTFAMHTFVKGARIKLAAARVANPI